MSTEMLIIFGQELDFKDDSGSPVRLATLLLTDPFHKSDSKAITGHSVTKFTIPLDDYLMLGCKAPMMVDAEIGILPNGKAQLLSVKNAVACRNVFDVAALSGKPAGKAK